jgi:hypothetical protein
VIEDLIRLDNRLNAGRKILERHVAPSAIFAFLSTQTLERVRFTSFDYSAGDSGEALLELTGETDTFSTIALQSDQFGGSKALRDVIFSDIIISAETGRVTFSVSAKADSSLLSFTNNLGAVVSLPQEVIEAVATTTEESVGTTTQP